MNNLNKKRKTETKHRKRGDNEVMQRDREGEILIERELGVGTSQLTCNLLL